VSQICGSDAGVPDGTFLYQKSQFWSNLEGLGMENIDILFGHLEYCSAIWYMLFPFYIFCGHLVFFPPFGYLVPSKIWQPCSYDLSPFTKIRFRMKRCPGARWSGCPHTDRKIMGSNPSQSEKC
jgi:hypothetical protein